AGKERKKIGRRTKRRFGKRRRSCERTSRASGSSLICRWRWKERSFSSRFGGNCKGSPTEKRFRIWNWQDGSGIQRQCGRLAWRMGKIRFRVLCRAIARWEATEAGRDAAGEWRTSGSCWNWSVDREDCFEQGRIEVQESKLEKRNSKIRGKLERTQGEEGFLGKANFVMRPGLE